MRVCSVCLTTMSILGCNTTGLPWHWCPRCGSLRTCDGLFSVPAIAQEVLKVPPRGELVNPEQDTGNVE